MNKEPTRSAGFINRRTADFSELCLIFQKKYSIINIENKERSFQTNDARGVEGSGNYT